MRFADEYHEYLAFAGYCKVCGTGDPPGGIICDACHGEWMKWQSRNGFDFPDEDMFMEYLYILRVEQIKEFHNTRQQILGKQNASVNRY